MRILKAVILEENYKKELDSLGFELDRFDIAASAINIAFFLKTNEYKKEALICLNIDYLNEMIGYKINFYVLDDDSENKKHIYTLQNELKSFEKIGERNFLKYSEDLHEAKKDLLDLARAYNKIFLNDSLNGGLTA